MRTTLTLDDDVAAELLRLQQESGEPWKAVVNRSIREGIAAIHVEKRRRRPVMRTRSVRLGAPRVPEISNVHEILALVEGDGHR